MYPKEKATVRVGMGSGGDESITVYGIADNSQYISLPADVPEGSVFASTAFRDKFYLKEGDVCKVVIYEINMEQKYVKFKLA